MNEETIEQVAEPADVAAAPEANVNGDAPPAAERRATEDSGQVANLPHALDRIASHPDLTPAMRQRLTELVQRQPPGEGPPQIGLDDALALLAQAVPSQLRLDPGELPMAPHPEGEAFFTGDGAADADQHAAAVASEQLALSGLLRR